MIMGFIKVEVIIGKIILVPKKDKGSVRGESLGRNGEFHDPFYHNELTADLPSVKHNVDENRAMNHKRWMERK
jgi:hypothetical protein